MNNKRVVTLGKDDVYSLNSKLKQCVMVMSREYYQSDKEVKAVFENYEGHRQSLKSCEQRNRVLQHDLDEIRKDEQNNVTKQMMNNISDASLGYALPISITNKDNDYHHSSSSGDTTNETFEADLKVRKTETIPP